MFDVVPNNGDILLVRNGLTEVEGQMDDSPPAHPVLHQNYPNPFNPATTIMYSLSENAYGSLKVSNLLGQELETLVDKEMAVGAHNVSWNARHEPSGVDFFKIDAGAYSSINKMILSK